MVNLISLLLIVLLYHIQIVTGRSIEFSVGESSFSQKYFHNFTFIIKNSRVYLDMHVRKPIIKGWKAHLEFQLGEGKTKNYQSLFTYTIDVCNVINAVKTNLFKKWYYNLLKYGNFLRNCTQDIGHYYVNGWQFDDNLVPSFLYAGSYRLITYNFYGKYRSRREDFIMSCSAEAVIK